jgi:peptide/nickel transport system substrate-binding protein
MKRSVCFNDKKLKELLISAILIAAFILAPIMVPNAAEAAGKDAVIMGMWSSPGNSMLPHFYQLGYARAVYRVVFSSLLSWDDDGNIVPRMAESYEISPDGQTYRFKIRANAYWHDGQPVTSEDVAFTIRCLTDPDYSFMDFNLVAGIAGAKARKKGEAKELSGFKIIDDKTFEVKTNGVFAPLLDGFTALHILPFHVLKDIPVKELAGSSFAAAPTVGCGPYKFVKYATDQYVEFVRFDKYFLGTPKIERVFLRIVSPDTAIAQLERGELDLVIGQGLANIPNIEIPRIKKVATLDVQHASGQSSQGLMLVCSQEKLKDLRVRGAIAHAINRAGIVDKILIGGGTVTAIPRAAGYPFFSEDQLEAREYSKDKAGELLKEAGWQKETVLRLAVPTGNKERIQWATVAQQNLTEAGMKVDLQQMDIATMIKTVRKTPEKIDGFFVGYKNYMDPYMYYHRRFHTDSIQGGNLLFYSNSEMDRLIDASATTVDMKERAKLFNRIQEILYEELPVIPIVCPTSTIAVNKRVKGPKNSILPVTRNIHEWEIQ